MTMDHEIPTVYMADWEANEARLNDYQSCTWDLRYVTFTHNSLNVKWTIITQYIIKWGVTFERIEIGVIGKKCDEKLNDGV